MPPLFAAMAYVNADRNFFFGAILRINWTGCCPKSGCLLARSLQSVIRSRSPSSHANRFADRNDTQKDALLGNSPVWYGEWSLSTGFNATDDFLCKWADAQKLKYNESAGWLVRPSSSFGYLFSLN
jgi:hypothetical protein